MTEREMIRCIVSLLVILSFGPALRAQSPTPYYVDLSRIATTTLENDGHDGWSREGVNDMFLYPPLPKGEFSRNGYRFKLADENKGKTVVMLKGKSLPDLPEEATAAVADVKGKFVYVLQNAVRSVNGQPANYRVAVYTVRYADGTDVEIPVRDGIEIRRWWTGQWYDNSGASSWPIIMGTNAVAVKWKQHVGVWAMQWANPHPEKAIRSIRFRSEGHASPAILAVTIADEDWHRGPDVKKDYARPDGPPADFFSEKLASEQPIVFAEMRKLGMVRGIRSVELIRADLLAVTLDAVVSEGVGLNNAKAAALQQNDAFVVASEDDPSYKKPLAPVRVGRQSFEYWNGDIGRFVQNQVYWHTYYLALPTPLTSGHRYTVRATQLPKDFETSQVFAYDESTSITPAIKVNQIAYAAQSERRYAYLGWWAADSGQVEYSGLDRFLVIDETNNQAALTGTMTVRKQDDELSGEQVLEMDISKLDPGKYHIVVPGLGRSVSFEVGGDQFRSLYYHTNRVFYHQRCGMELAAPFTEFVKPACHLHVYKSGHMVGSPSYTPKPNEPTRTFRGGYHDAADFDTFTYHLRATAQVLSAYEAHPAVFGDGDLNIPESKNRIPDVLDEAAWALSFYREHQQDDGGVPLGRGNDQDAMRAWEREHKGSRPEFGVFPPTSMSSTEFAAVAALYGRILSKFDAKAGRGYVDSARRAFAWAQKNDKEGAGDRGRDLFLAWAAAELFNATGDNAYNEEFKRLHRAGATRRYHWSLTAYVPGCLWAYATSTQGAVDTTIQQELRQLIIERADKVARDTDTPAYRVGRGADGKANGWGNLNGGGHWADPCLRAYWLTKEPKYLTAASLNADFQLGANPLSRTFISGIGSRSPRHPQISAFLYTGPNKTLDTVKGITVYGLASAMPPWYPETPAWRRWRDIGNGGAEISSEFTITETTGASAMLYSTLYALERQAK